MADTLISNTVIYSYTHSFCAMLCMNKKVKNEIDESSRIFLISEYLTRWGPGLLRLGAIMSFGGYCVSRPGLLRLGAVVG